MKQEKSNFSFFIKTIFLSIGIGIVLSILVGILLFFLLQDDFSSRNNYGAPFVAVIMGMLVTFILAVIGTSLVRLKRYLNKN